MKLSGVLSSKTSSMKTMWPPPSVVLEEELEQRGVLLKQWDRHLNHMCPGLAHYGHISKHITLTIQHHVVTSGPRLVVVCCCCC